MGRHLACALTLAIGISQSALAGEPVAPMQPELVVPDLNATSAQPASGEGEKYFYFHRSNTDFPTALADVRQCDALARGLNPDTGAPLFGGMALALLADAMNAANRRNLRRINIRRCMFFKGYGRYGVAKATWQSFNFQEGDGNGPSGSQRDALLQLQARIACGPRPQSAELGE